MLSFLFTTVGNNLTGNSWDCLSNWFKCALNLLFRSSCWLCKWVFYGRWWVQGFFYFPWVLIWCNDDKKKFTRKIAAVLKITILLWWWTALLNSLSYTEQEEMGKIFLGCKTQEKKRKYFWYKWNSVDPQVGINNPLHRFLHHCEGYRNLPWFLDEGASWDPGGVVPGLHLHWVQEQFRAMNSL